MAGLGRRTHYRKHLTDAVLHDFPEPQQDECIAKVVATRGSNQFDVLVAGNTSSTLAILPSKFNKLIWVKRGDFCIVKTGDDDDSDDEDVSGGVRYLITHILYKEQIKHLKAKNLWPNDEQFETGEGGESLASRARSEKEAKGTSGDEDEEHDDGIVYDTGVDDEFFVNANRVNVMQIQDSSESDSSDDDRDIQQQETDDGIVYDTQDDDLFADTNRVAALRIEDSESESSEEEKEEQDIQQQETDDGVDYDTGNVLEDMENEDDAILQQETDDGIIFDTGDAEEVPDPSSHQASQSFVSENSDDEDDDAIREQTTEDDIVYDTGDAEEVADPSSHHESDNIDDDDDDDDDDIDDIVQNETSDSLMFDTGKQVAQQCDGIFKSDAAGDVQPQRNGNGGRQKSAHDLV